MLRAALLFGAILILPTSAGATGQVLCRSEADDIAALQMFNRSVNTYVEMTRRLHVPLSPWIGSDLEAMAVARDSLARAIAAERRDARQGDIFGPEVADFFRVRVDASGALEGRQLAPARCTEEAEDARCEPMPIVNSRLAWMWSAPVGDALARALPPLPMELQYRLSPDGSVLLLVDVRAALVVDLMDVAPASS
jgi:hypothetical protein